MPVSLKTFSQRRLYKRLWYFENTTAIHTTGLGMRPKCMTVVSGYPVCVNQQSEFPMIVSYQVLWIRLTGNCFWLHGCSCPVFLHDQKYATLEHHEHCIVCVCVYMHSSGSVQKEVTITYTHSYTEDECYY